MDILAGVIFNRTSIIEHLILGLNLSMVRINKKLFNVHGIKNPTAFVSLSI